jgi:putative transcriptional regulator
MDKTVSSLTGKLLVAMPSIGDPRFDHSVIYVCSHSDDGTMGLIVNKTDPDIRFSDLLNDLGIAPTDGRRELRVHVGGPVESGRGFVLHSADFEAKSGTLKVDAAVSMSSTTEILEEILAGRGPTSAMFALGYAGWGPLQLESEIAANGWLVAEATPDILYGRANDLKWTAALKALGIDPLLLSTEAGRA